MSSQGMTTRFRYTREHSAELTGSWFLPAALLTHSLVTRPGTWRAWALDTGHLFHSINWELSSSSRFGEVQPLPGVSGQQIDTRDTVELFWGAVGLFSQVYTVGTAPHRPGWWALRDPGWLQPCLSDVPVPEQHQRVLTNPTESQLTCSLLFLLLLLFPPLPFMYICFQGNSSACTWTASLGPEALLCCSGASRYRLQKPYGVS